jgi:hypothetical protein
VNSSQFVDVVALPPPGNFMTEKRLRTAERCGHALFP